MHTKTHSSYSAGIYALFFIIVVFFGIGIVKLFTLRFEVGDIYPAYSSLRSDPLGTKALYKSLESLENIHVDRNYRSIHQFDTGDACCLFVLGAKNDDLSYIKRDTIEKYELFLTNGGRMVFSFLPVQPQSPEENRTKEEAEVKSDEQIEENDCPENDSTDNSESEGDDAIKSRDKDPYISLADHWGVAFEYLESFNNDETKAPSSIEKKGLSQNKPVPPWHTALYFTFPDTNEPGNIKPNNNKPENNVIENSWRVIYSAHGHPVIIERDFGKGTIVFSSDSYIFSNEALLKNRHSDLLSWFIGNHSYIIFDESHLGIKENIGVAGLIRKYNLYWLIFGGLIFSALFIWKNSSHFIPPTKDDSDIQTIKYASTRDYAAGLTSLLRRNIGPKEILNVCYAQWKKSSAYSRRVLQGQTDKMATIKKIAEPSHEKLPKQQETVQSYQAISKILSKRKIT